MEKSMQTLMAISFLVIGLSHIFQSRAWARFFIVIRQAGEAGCFVNAFLNLITGVLIVSFHNVWTGPAAVLTVMGWIMCAKAFLYFVFPQLGLVSLGFVTEEKAHRFIAPGVFLLLLSGISAYLGRVA